MNKLTKFIFICFMSTTITACSGGGGSSTTGGSTTPSSGGSSSSTISLSGAVSKGPVMNATVDIYTFNTNGTQGLFVIGGITTDANGAWSASIPTTATGPFMIIATGGSFIDEYTGATVPLGVVPLRGILPTGATSAAITPITDAAVSTIQQMVTDGYASSPANALSTVQTNYVNSIGFDPIATIPPAPANLAGATADELRYAAVLGGFSTLANDAYAQLSAGGNTPDRMAIIAQMANDFAADGSIDGYGNAAAPLTVSVGGTPQALNGVFTGGGNLGAAVGTYQGLPSAPATVAGAAVTVTPVDFTATLFVDTTNPVVIAPSNINITVAVGTTSVAASDTTITTFLSGATASDNIGIVGAVTNNAPASFPIGTTTVVFSALDAANNTGTASATITVQTPAPDTTNPVVTAPANVTVSSSNTAAITAFLNGASATDNVGIIGSVTNNAPNPLPTGATVVTFSAMDAAGNTGTATATITITAAGGGTGGVVTLNASIFCPVSSTPTTASTLNGWTLAQPSVSGVNLRTVVEGNGVFLAAGDFGQILRSTDKVNWTAINSGITTNIQNIIWDGTAFIIPGDPTLISCDGFNWASKALAITLNGTPSTLSLGNLHLANKYYALRGNAMYQSTDAVNWVGATIPSVTAAGKFASLSLVANNGTTFVAKTLNPETTLVSSDSGTTWQTVAAAPTGYRLLYWNGTHFVADLNFDIATSTDGISWVTTPIAGGIAFSTVWTPHMITYQGTHVRYGGNDFMQGSSYNNNGGLYIPNATNIWGEVRWFDTNGKKLHKINHAIVTSTNSLLIVGDGGMIAETSTSPLPLLNATSTNPWTRLSNDLSPTPLRKIASNGTSFVAVGDFGDILYSTDGYSWAKASLPTYKPTVSLTIPIDKNFNEILWTGAEYLAIGDNTTLLTSPNGQTWTLNGVVQASGVSSVPSILDPSNGTIVRSDNYIHTKAAGVYRLGNNASKWTKVDISGGSTVGATAFANNGTRFVAVGSYGMSSTLTPSGVWTPVTLTNIASVNTYTFVGVAYNGTSFLAIANNTTTNTQIIIQSADGLAWTQVTNLVGAPNMGKALYGGSGKFVSLGNTPKESLDGGITWTNMLPHQTLSPNGSNYDLWYNYLKTPTHEFLVGYRKTILVK